MTIAKSDFIKNQLSKMAKKISTFTESDFMIPGTITDADIVDFEKRSETIKTELDKTIQRFKTFSEDMKSRTG